MNHVFSLASFVTWRTGERQNRAVQPSRRLLAAAAAAVTGGSPANGCAVDEDTRRSVP
jgi:hypothetical protein